MKKTKTGFIGDKIKGVDMAFSMNGPARENVLQPKQYRIGIDTFTRAKKTMSKERLIGFCQGNIDKYIWRDKDSDLDDLYKARDYIDLWIETLKKDNK